MGSPKTWGTVFKGHSIKKFENHCPSPSGDILTGIKLKMSCLASSIRMTCFALVCFLPMCAMLPTWFSCVKKTELSLKLLWTNLYLIWFWCPWNSPAKILSIFCFYISWSFTHFLIEGLAEQHKAWYDASLENPFLHFRKDEMKE